LDAGKSMMYLTDWLTKQLVYSPSDTEDGIRDEMQLVVERVSLNLNMNVL